MKGENFQGHNFDSFGVFVNRKLLCVTLSETSNGGEVDLSKIRIIQFAFECLHVSCHYTQQIFYSNFAILRCWTEKKLINTAGKYSEKRIGSVPSIPHFPGEQEGIADGKAEDLSFPFLP